MRVATLSVLLHLYETRSCLKAGALNGLVLVSALRTGLGPVGLGGWAITGTLV